MTYDRTQGDPKIVLTEDGADLVIKGGQPVMDSGLENAILISLFSEESWWGNAYMDPSMPIKSRFYALTRKPLRISRFAELEQAIRADLAPLVADGVIGDPQVRVSAPTGTQLQVAILVQPSEGDQTALLLSKYGQNWVVQSSNPASARV